MKRRLGPFLLLASVPSLFGCALNVPQLQPAAPPQPPVCLPTRDEKPWTASRFLEMGDHTRDGAIEMEADRGFAMAPQMQLRVEPWSRPLNDARDCYKRALRVSPDNYGASLGLGVVYLTVAQRMEARSPLRHSTLASAKRHLGRAYLLRKGQMEPLYHLAMVAIAESRTDVALTFLTHLTQAGFREGESHALMGYISEMKRSNEAAAKHYASALEAGAPSAMLRFIEVRTQLPHLRPFFTRR